MDSIFCWIQSCGGRPWHFGCPTTLPTFLPRRVFRRLPRLSLLQRAFLHLPLRGSRAGPSGPIQTAFGICCLRGRVNSVSQSVSHSFIGTYIHSFIRSFTHKIIHSFTQSFIHLYIHSFIQSFIHVYSLVLFIHSLVLSICSSFIDTFCSFIH